jgi:hypothetical protein
MLYPTYPIASSLQHRFSTARRWSLGTATFAVAALKPFGEMA